MPQFEFRFLVCAFLPSVPLSLIILLPFYGILSNEGGAVFVAILVATSGILGLVVDGARHMLEKFLCFGEETYIWPEMAPQELEEIKKEGKKVDRSVYQFYVSKWEGYFHVYEFYANFAFSTLVGLTLVILPGNTFSIRRLLGRAADLAVLLLMILVFLCIIFSGYYCCKKKKELEDTFKISDKKINWILPIVFFLWWVVVALNFLLVKYFRQGVFKMSWMLIVIVAIISGTVFAMFVIYLGHKQRMAMIEKGIKPEELHPPHKPEDMLIGGLVVIGIGLAFLVTKILGRLTAWLMLPGFILLFIGIALTVSYYLTRKLKRG